MKKREKTNGRKPLLKGRDYYLENGRYVFTAHYLLQRGYCCGSGCRHCPYGQNETAGQAEGADCDSPPEKQ